MEKRNVGDIAIEVMKEENMDLVGYSEFGMLDEIFSRAVKEGIIKKIGSRGGRLRNHPLNIHSRVLNFLDKDKRFKKFLMRCTNGRAEVLVRCFEIKKEVRNSSHD